VNNRTLVMSRAENLFPHWKVFLEKLGYRNVLFTCKERDSLDALIKDYKPENLIFGCGFYQRATPYMMLRMLKRLPRMNVVAVNVHEFPDDLGMRFIANGVQSYVNMMDGMDEFVKGLCIVRDGGIYIAKGVMDRLEMRREFPKAANEISDREIEVLGLICSGYMELEMAETMGISRKTIINHRTSLYTNLSVRNPAELMLCALQNDFVNKDELDFYPRGFTVNPQPFKEIFT